MPEIVSEVREFRRGHSLSSPPQDAPVTLAEIARVALERYYVAQRAAHDAWCAKRKANDAPRRAVYSAPDSARPWDVSDCGGPTVTEQAKDDLKKVMLCLLGNDPADAARRLKFIAYQIENAVKRQEEKTARAERAERTARKRELKREKIEREERRLARERERARKRLGFGIRGVAS
jgi:hypothetical protein